MSTVPTITTDEEFLGPKWQPCGQVTPPYQPGNNLGKGTPRLVDIRRGIET